MAEISDEVFAEVEAGNGNENDCTPQVGDDFVGLKINAPKVVFYIPGVRHSITDAFAKMMICGVYQVEAEAVDQLGGIKQAITVSAIDVVSHTPYVSKLGAPKWMDAVSDPPPPRALPPQPNRTRFYMGFFNENVLDYLDLPEKPGTYQVFVSLLKYKSNVVTVTLKPRD